MDFETTFQQLNPEQQDAVQHIDGPVIILAGPGTGKTQLLSVRTAHILRQTDLYPSNILLLTYTNAGVKAMRERLAKTLGPDGYDVVVETFHGFSNALISDSEEAASVKGDRIEMTDLERITLLEYLLDHNDGLHAIRHPNAPYLYRRDIESNMSALKRDGINPLMLTQFLDRYKPDGTLFEEKHLKRLKAFSILYSAYEAAKLPQSSYPHFDARGRYDFDDMILLSIEALQNEPELLAKTQEQFQYVMVDEFQDTNGSQLKLLQTLFSQAKSNICVVGDDDQSIYRFQGASVGNFHLFEDMYLDPKKIVLKKNYRCRESILQSASDIIQKIPIQERVMGKDLSAERGNAPDAVQSFLFGTPEEELTFLVRQIKELPEEEKNDTAVLVRTRKQAQLVIEAFLQSGVPYTTDGKEDIRGEHRVQQLIKILQLAHLELDFEQKDLLLFELLLSDFWKIDHADLLRFTTFVRQKKSDYRKQLKRKKNKTPQEYRLEEEHQGLLFEKSETSGDHQFVQPSFLSELLLRFPSPKRISVHEDEAPREEETLSLSICQELPFSSPHALHRAAWTLQRLVERASHYPVYSLIMHFLQDTGIVDYILSIYADDEVLRLRELRSISSFVENMKKASHANPGIMADSYYRDLVQLETHSIALAGEMVSSSQEGIRILTAHGSKGLEFRNVFIPFCLQDKSWPKRPLPNKIPLPHELMVGQELIHDKQQEKLLTQYDETRLFYVAASRAKDRLVFTAAPQNKEVLSEFLSSNNLAPEKQTILSEEETLLHILKQIPQDDPVAQSKEALRGMIEDLTLSPSSVNTYLSCPRKFLYHHLLKAPQPKTQALVYGQCIHKALEKSFRRYMKEGNLPPLQYFEDQFLQELDWHGVEQSIRQGCLQKLQRAKDWYQQSLNQGAVKPLELERKITRKLPGGIIFTGQFDKVEAVGKRGEVRVIDYKTGEPDKHIKAIENCQDLFSADCDDYLRQLVAYKLLYEKGYRSSRVSSASLVFIDPVRATVKKYGLEEGVFTSKTVVLNGEMMKDYEKLLFEIWEKIQNLSFDRLPSYSKDFCDYCPYKGICWK